MSGAIPTLSRGGSWQPDATPATLDKSDPTYGMSNGGANPNPRYFPGSQFGVRSGPHLGGPFARAPVSHVGWASQPGGMMPGNQVAFGPGNPAIRRVGNSTGPVPSVVATENARQWNVPLTEGANWEMQAGAPKPMTPEPNYARHVGPMYGGVEGENGMLGPAIGGGVPSIALRPGGGYAASAVGRGRQTVYRDRAESLPAPPPPSTLETESIKRKSRRARAKRDCAESKTPSGSSSRRPRQPSTKSVQHHHLASDGTSANAHSLVSTRQESKKVSEQKQSASDLGRTTAMTPKNPKKPKQASPDRSTHTKSSSTRSTPSPPDKHGSTLDFTALQGFDTDSRKSSTFDLSSLTPKLPSASGQNGQYPSRPTGPGLIRTKIDAPPGYIPPMADEGYDRYLPHPAAPVPDRVDRHLASNLNAALTLTGRVNTGEMVEYGSAMTRTVRQADPKSSIDYRSRTCSKKDPLGPPAEYTPPGFPLPTRPFGGDYVTHNRSGPAMARHGVAWVRQKDVDGVALPDAPEGPRWVQARPPRGEEVRGGGWWESGREGGIGGGGRG